MFIWLETGVTTEGSCSFFFIMITQIVYPETRSYSYTLLCSYWLSRSDIPEIFPQHYNHSISDELY